MKIKIVRWARHPSGKLEGFVDVQIIDWGLMIQGCKLFRNDKGSWISLPEKEYTDKEGTRKWQSFLHFEDAIFKDFQHEVKAALKAHRENEDGVPANNQPSKDNAPPVDQDDIPF